MSYTVDDTITAVRNLISESSETGFYSPSYLLEQLNISIKSRVIPDLFAIAKYTLLEGLYTLDEDKTLVETVGKAYWEYDFSALLAYSLSIKAWIKISSTYYEGIHFDASEIWKYKDDKYAYFKPNYPFTIIGKKIRFYELGDSFGVSPTVDLEYIKMPVYISGNTVLLSDHVVEAFLIPIMCYEAIRREPEMPKIKAEAFKVDYMEALKVIAGTYGYVAGPEPLPIEKIGKALGG